MIVDRPQQVGMLPGLMAKACVLATLSLLGGCVTLAKLDLSASAPGNGAFFQDHTKPDTYPGRAIAEGNIYSCRMGIEHMARERFEPPKAELFGRLLAKANPPLAAKNIVLERFDVYRNYRLRALSGGRAMGGAIFAAIASSADRKNNPAMDLERFSLREDPGDGQWKSGENQVGCDGRAEGEYYASEVNGGHDVVVTWLSFTVDGMPYNFRSAYQYQFDQASAPQGVDEIAKAIELTVAAVAVRISE